MLPQAELDLVRRERELPGLAKLLDAEAFCDALSATASVKTLRAAKLRYLRYKPGQNCLAAYTLDVGGATVECHAKAYRLADAEKIEKAELRSNIAGPLGEGRFTWPRLGIEICIFPNDNKLRSLALVTNDARREDFLSRHLPEHAGLWNSTIRTLAYKPERRWVGALEVDGTPLAVCKLYGNTAFEAVRSKAKHFMPGEVLRLAPLLGRSKGRGALFFGWQPGQLLSQAMLAPGFDPSVLARLGFALAELQRQQIPSLPQPVLMRDAHALLVLGEFVGFLLPRVARRVRELAGHIAASLVNLPPGDATVHGDFYAKQILLQDEQITVLDLDEAAHGHALTDLGSFLAHLEREVIAGRLTAQRRENMQRCLLAGYRVGSLAVDEKQLPLHLAARLFARLPDFFRSHDSAWPEQTEALVDRIETILGHPPAGKRRPRLDGQLLNLESALAPMEIEPKLKALLAGCEPPLTDVALQRVALWRHKPGRRALIEYELELQRNGRVEPLGLLGKLRRRGVDMENLAAVRELGEGNFAANSSHQVSIPESFGVIPELNMTLQRRVPGQCLGDLLPSTAGIAAARRAADAICKLHHNGILLSKTHTIADELEILEARLCALATQRPEWEERLATLLQGCRHLAARLHIVSPRPIHRDFYHDQLLFEGNRVWLLDLDLLCAGDPALDAGNFIGHLIEWGVRSPSERGSLKNAAAAFTDRFLELSGTALPEAVEIYTTLTLVRHVSLSTQFPERAPFTEQILELCEERCGFASNSILVTPGAAHSL